MELIISFSTRRNQKEILSLSRQYFFENGFKEVHIRKSALVFTKGSGFHNMVAFNPLSWKTRINITTDASHPSGITVYATFNIDTSYQAVRQIEAAAWQCFIENYKASIEGCLVVDSSRLGYEAAKNNYGTALRTAGVILVGGVLLLLIERWLFVLTGIVSLKVFFAFIGIAIVIAFLL